MEIVNIAEKLGSFTEHWSPKIIGELNGQQIRLSKFKGESVWHHHENEDQMFLVIKGELTLGFREGDKVLNEGEFIIVPKGVEHKPSITCISFFKSIGKSELFIKLFKLSFFFEKYSALK